MKTSNYEQIVIDILKKNKINFKREQTFYGLKGFKNPLRFDFVIYDSEGKIKYFIEVNGEQHYHAYSHWGGERGLLKRKEYDRKKMGYALANNIQMICLPYWDIKNTLTYEDITTNKKYLVKSIWHSDKLIK